MSGPSKVTASRRPVVMSLAETEHFWLWVQAVARGVDGVASCWRRHRTRCLLPSIYWGANDTAAASMKHHFAANPIFLVVNVREAEVGACS
jgi:hypothetical protein